MSALKDFFTNPAFKGFYILLIASFIFFYFVLKVINPRMVQQYNPKDPSSPLNSIWKNILYSLLFSIVLTAIIMFISYRASKREQKLKKVTNNK
jgi:ABC-type antimicrobial peptide transport system permease subunit